MAYFDQDTSTSFWEQTDNSRRCSRRDDYNRRHKEKEGREGKYGKQQEGRSGVRQEKYNRRDRGEKKQRKKLQQEM